MDDSNDVRPRSAHHASDPSLEDMLRRARDAHLGGTHHLPSLDQPMQANLRPATTPSGTRPLFGGWALMLVGILIGMLLSYGVVQWSRTPRDDAQQSPSPTTALSPVTAPPTATPVPTNTPTPTDAPTAAPLPVTATELAALAQRFYDTIGPYAGTYVLMDTPALQTISSDSTHMTLCVAYQYASAADPNTAVGSDARWFRYTFSSTGGWAVEAMGPAASCSLS